jgi:hypothetical protein
MYISRSFESGTLISPAVLMRDDSPVHGTKTKKYLQAFLLSFGFVPSSAAHASENIREHISALKRVEKIRDEASERAGVTD